VPKIAERITSLREDYRENERLAWYLRGWCWGETRINWTGYIFYGADVTIGGLDLLEQVLDDLASMELHISGYFHAQGEDGERNIAYRIVHDVWHTEESTELVDDP
jgi:hypothetical protein